MQPLVCPLCRIALSPTDSVCPRDGHAGREVAWLSVPPALGPRFHTLQPFAHGDSGSLYIADEPETGRRGLLKILAPVAKEQLAERQRLRRELVKQTTLARSHLVVPLASGDAGGATWIFREWLEGVSLEVRLSRGGPLQQTEALAIAAQIAGALDELHRGGLLHRDIKPGHVFLQPTSHGLPRVLLLDAGIVSPIALRSGTLYGTPGYVAPEQLLGNLVSFRSDLYSLGSVLYRMLTGRPAFEGDDDGHVLDAQRQGELPPVPPTLPPGIRQLLQSLLSREPQERPFSAQKLRRTLEPFLPDDALIGRTPTSSFEMLPRERKPAAVLASGTLRPPPPPSVRASASSTLLAPSSAVPAPAPATQLASEERTDSVELDQVEEELLARSRPPPPPPEAQQPTDKTMPIRLDQILAVADGSRGAARPPPALVETPHEDATLVDAPRDPEPAPFGAANDFRPHLAGTAPAAHDVRLRDEPAPAGSDFRPRDAAPLGVDFQPRDDAAPLAPTTNDARFSDASGHGTVRAPIAPPSESTIEIDDQLAHVIAEHERQQGAGTEAPRAVPAGKRTLVGIGIGALRDPAADLAGSGGPEAATPAYEAARSTGPGEPAPRFVSPKSTLPLGSALPSASSLQGMTAPSAAVQPGAAAPLEPRAAYVQPASSVPSGRRSPERDIPTEPIPVDRSSEEDLGPVPSPWWSFGGDERRALIYGSAALVGLAVLGVGVSALFSRDSAREPAAAAVAPPPPVPPVVTQPPREELAAAEPAAEPAPPVAERPARREREHAAPAPAPAKPTKPEPVAKAKREAAKPSPAKATATSKAPPAKEAAPSKPAAPPSKPAAPDNAALFAEAADQARAHYSAKRYKDAAAAYERAIRYDAGNAGIYAGLGAARLQLGDDRGAVQAYQRAVQLSPSNSKFHSALGQAYLLMGDTGRARAAYKQALALDPKNESAKNALSKL